MFFSYFYPLIGVPISEFFRPINLSTETKYFVFLLLLLLSIPLGLTINAFSWIFLGKLQVDIEGFIFDDYIKINGEHTAKTENGKLNIYKIKSIFYSLFLKHSKKALLFDRIFKFYELGKPCKNSLCCKFKDCKGLFYCYSRWIEETLSCYYPEESDSLGYLEGMIQFIRSLLFLSFCILFLRILHYFAKEFDYTFINLLSLLVWSFIVVVFILILLIALAGVSFYYDIYNLTKGYILYIKEEIPDDQNIEKIVSTLAQKSNRYKEIPKPKC